MASNTDNIKVNQLTNPTNNSLFGNLNLGQSGLSNQTIPSGNINNFGVKTNVNTSLLPKSTTGVATGGLIDYTSTKPVTTQYPLPTKTAPVGVLAPTKQTIQSTQIQTLPQSNQTQAAYTPIANNVPDVSTINPATLNTKPYQIPQTQPTDYNSFANSLITGGAGFQSTDELQNRANQEQASLDSQQSEIQKLIQELGINRSQEAQNLQQTYDVQDNTRKLMDLQTQYAQQKAAYDQLAYQTGGQNIPTVFQSGQQALVRGQQAIALGSLAAQIQMQQGNVNTALSTIQKTLDLKYSPLEQQLNNKLAFYRQNYDQLTNAQKRVADRQTLLIDAQKTKINQNKQIQDAIQSAIDKSIIDPNIGLKALADIATGVKTPEKAIADLNLNTDGTTGNSYGQQVVNGTLQLIGGDISQSTTVADAIKQVGLNKIISGIVAQEGGTPQGTNNPGNIKYVGQKGATQGRPASDGGYFANFNTPQDFQNAISNIINNAAKKGKLMGDFIASYKGVTLAPKVDARQYGLLANVAGFNPNNFLDKSAVNYINEYVYQGRTPSASKNPNIVQRAQDLFYQATGQSLPDTTILKANKELVTKNNALINNLGIQENTIKENFGLNLENLKKSDLNSSISPINNLVNSIKGWLSDPSVAAYTAQNITLQNELGSLLALKNASGTTVQDKLESASLLKKGASINEQKAVLNILLQEAANAHGAITEINSQLNKQIDPLQKFNQSTETQATQATQTTQFSNAQINGLSVTIPGTGTITFPSQSALEAFKKDQGL